MILTREQLEERLVALHQASLELVQDISLDSLLERIAELARDQVQARYAAVGVLDESGNLEKFIPIGMDPEEVARLDHPPVGRGLIGALMHTNEIIRIPEVSDHPLSSGFPPNHPVMHSFLGVPIRLGERQLGQIYLTDKITALEFTEDDQQVIETLASYAAVAISNARLYQQLAERDEALTRRNQDLALLNELATTLASAPEVDEILDIALTRVVEYLVVDAGEIFLRDEAGKQLRLVLHRGSAVDTLWTRDRFAVGEGLIGLTAADGQPHFLIIPDKNERFLRKTTQSNIHQIACFPLTARSGVVGVLCVVTRQSRLLNDLESQFLTALSAWIGTAVENVHLNLQSRRLVVLEERERIGMDLHDGIIQSIYAVGLTLEHARLLLPEDKQQSKKRIDQAIADLNSTIRDIRAYILDLRPRQLHEENLVDGLQRLVAEFRANTSIEVTLKAPADGLAKSLPTLHAVALFHICQEALANVAKHSHASHVEIYLWTTSDRALLEISDDGRGFDQSKTTTSIGHGLSNMHTRARNVGGDVEITSEPGEGTTILAWVPASNPKLTKNG
ncbi:MAG TPA: GAF domain-containing sensor histidine kinase [Anaerolineaceae bacterium]|nr:GAF domain-containing sensor histidine kinase [Anaerolineaceae bacterium]